jgi:hypothetical protein
LLPHPDLVRDELGVGESGRPIGAARLLLEGYLEHPHASEALALPSELKKVLLLGGAPLTLLSGDW